MINHNLITEIFNQAVQEPRPPKPNNCRESRLRSHQTVEDLEVLLNAEGKAVLDKLLDQWMEVEAKGNEETFVLGFRLGARLMQEILEKDSSLT